MSTYHFSMITLQFGLIGLVIGLTCGLHIEKLWKRMIYDALVYLAIATIIVLVK